MPPKAKRPEPRKGKMVAVKVKKSLNSFVTLKPGSEAFERLLDTSTIAVREWIARNTFHFAQAEKIRSRHAEIGSQLDASGISPDTEERASAIIPGSADFPPEPAIASPQVCSVHDETPSSATKTPSLKLKFGGTPTPGPSVAKPIPSTPVHDDAPNGSSKKRKRPIPGVDSESTVGVQPARVLSLKLNTKQPPSSSKNSAITPGIKLKTKGKVPKRLQGVGYDSELEDREVDPTILEAFVLRMLPCDDCDYIRDAIANGTVGVSLLQKGADIRLRFLDVNGRRGILIVRGNQYAFTIVDLPTITEGMKSWDKKNFIKSVDISQMCLVLGRCANDEEARNYILPPDVNPKNYQYAHGLTAPMRNVRKRRFERTTRTRLDDIEAIERKVNSLLEADAKSTDVTWEILDRDPRQDEDDSSSDGSYGSDEDAEGEEVDSYFPLTNGGRADTTQTQTPDQQYTNEDISALEAMFEDDPDDDPSVPPTLVAPPASIATTTGGIPTTTTTTNNTNTPTATPLDPASSSAAPSPAPEPPTDSDNDNDDDPADADADDASDSDHEASDEKAETLVKIRETEDKIESEKRKLKGTNNTILRRKIAGRIQALENDIKMMRRHAGIGKGGGGDGEEGSEEE